MNTAQLFSDARLDTATGVMSGAAILAQDLRGQTTGTIRVNALTRIQNVADSRSKTIPTTTRRAIERIDVSVAANGEFSQRQQAPQAHETPTGMMLVEVTQPLQELHIEIADFRRGQVEQYSATLPDGSPLPAWIKLDPATGRVTATPDNSNPLIKLNFMAQDANGSLRTLEIKIDLRALAKPADDVPSAMSRRQRRPVFMQQLVAHSQQWDGYGDQILVAFAD